MNTIAFYISNHGYGHITRNIPIVNHILEKNQDIKIIVICEKGQVQLLKSLIKNYNERLICIEKDLDVGLILKEGTLEVDLENLEIELNKYIDSWGKRIEEEKKFLIDNRIDLVVSDVVPWIFKATSELDIKSVIISNFTWAEIYKKLLYKGIWKEFVECYKLADKALIYPLFNLEIKSYFGNKDEIGLSIRGFNDNFVQDIRNKYKRPIVFVSVGRSVNLNNNINVENYPYTFICTKGINLTGNNVYELPVETNNTQDYIKASDYIITKAGWSTVAEAICAQVPMILVNRNDIEEDRVTIESIKSLKIGFDEEYEEIFNNLSENLKKADKLRRNFDNLNEKYSDCSNQIAELLLRDLRSEIIE